MKKMGRRSARGVALGLFVLGMLAVFSAAIAGCSDTSARRDDSSSAGAALIGGIPIGGNVVGVVHVEWLDGAGDPCVHGTGVMLTNDWMMSAAHVLTNIDCFGSSPAELKIIMKDAAGDQMADYPKGFFPQAFVHPRYTNELKKAKDENRPVDHKGWDIALMKVSAFNISGSTTQHRRWMTLNETSSYYGAFESFYGHGFSYWPTNNCPASPTPCISDNAVYEPLQTENFTLVQYPGFASPSKLIYKRYGTSKDMLAVERGGGATPNNTNFNSKTVVSGDSGGPMIDVTNPSTLEGDIVGIARDADFVEVWPSGASQCISRPEVSWFSAASGFRDFARVVLSFNAPSVKFDGMLARFAMEA
jgi:hypothetical protein